ncbi:MAG TPA: hypothetical protein VMM84_10530 [Pyrinomonadaceae bacterium]|nr:hypothetical protein [Pyrinomonadaceae bacterium]
MNPPNGRNTGRTNDSDNPNSDHDYAEKLKHQRQWFEVALASIGDGVITAMELLMVIASLANRKVMTP